MLDTLIVEPGRAVDLAARTTKDPAGLDVSKREAKDHLLPERRAEVIEQQKKLYAEEKRALLLVLQGTDTSGKDGTIRHVLRGISPSGTHVAAFGAPSHRESAHDYLWRVHRETPARGQIGVFNRSHYEDVIVTRVRGLIDADTWSRRFRHINEFERMLVDEGTVVVKCFLHISRDEQRERLQARLDRPEKRWKFDPADLDDRALWDDYQSTYEKTLGETSTAWAPWHVIPADRKWQRNLLIAEVLAATLRRMAPEPPPDPPGLDDVVIPE